MFDYVICTVCTDGQKIAIRLARRITTISKQLKSNLKKYNESLSQAQQLTWEDATDLSNELHRGSLFLSADIPSSVKLQAVQHQHHWLSLRICFSS